MSVTVGCRRNQGKEALRSLLDALATSISNVHSLLNSQASDLVAAFVAALVILGRFLSVILVLNYCFYKQHFFGN